MSKERGRRRAWLIFLCVVAVVALVSFLWLRSTSVFAVDTVTASATKHVTKEQIDQAVAPARGVSLLKVSTGTIETALEALPYVRSVHVYRAFPNGLDVQIEEYQPVARVRSGGGRIWLLADDGRLLDKAGQVGAAAGTAAENAALPLIVTASQFEEKAGQSVPREVLAALPVVQTMALPDISSSLPAIDHIAISAGGQVTLLLDGGTELRLGEPADLKQKIMDAAKIIQTYLRDGKTLEYVDMSAGDRAVAKPK